MRTEGDTQMLPRRERWWICWFSNFMMSMLGCRSSWLVSLRRGCFCWNIRSNAAIALVLGGTKKNTHRQLFNLCFKKEVREESRLNPTPLRRSFDDAKMKAQVRSYLGLQYELLQRSVYVSSVIAHRSTNWMDIVKNTWSNKKEVMFVSCLGKTKEQHPGFQRGPPP